MFSPLLGVKNAPSQILKCAQKVGILTKIDNKGKIK